MGLNDPRVGESNSIYPLVVETAQMILSWLCWPERPQGDHVSLNVPMVAELTGWNRLGMIEPVQMTFSIPTQTLAISEML